MAKSKQVTWLTWRSEICQCDWTAQEGVGHRSFSPAQGPTLTVLQVHNYCYHKYYYSNNKSHIKHYCFDSMSLPC